MTYRAFLELMAAHRIPSLDYEEGWLERELTTLEQRKWYVGANIGMARYSETRLAEPVANSTVNFGIVGGRKLSDSLSLEAGFDILLTVLAYFKDDTDGNPGLPPYTVGYSPDTDRILAGPNLWNTGPPNGQQRVDDILAIIAQYFHDCFV